MNIQPDPFSGRLLPNERMVWSGTPATGLMFTPIDIFLLPFSVVWIGFAVVWTAMAATGGAGPFFVLWGLMFVAIGVTLMWGRFWIDAWLRSRTRYALTDHRLLISRPEPFGTFTAVALDRLPEARLTERKDGRGSIRFGQPNIFAAGGFGLWLPSLDGTPQLVAILEPRRVFDMLQHMAARR